MTLRSKDRVFFEISPNVITLRIIEYKEGRDLGSYGWSDGDLMVLKNGDAALFLAALTEPGHDVDMRPGGPAVMWPFHGVAGDEPVLLKGDHETADLTYAEHRMLADAIRSRLWRLFL